jgi:hypothetical protein
MTVCVQTSQTKPLRTSTEKKKKLCNSAMAVKARHVVQIRVVPQTQRISRRYATRSCDSAPIFTTKKKSLPRFTPFALTAVSPAGPGEGIQVPEQEACD